MSHKPWTAFSRFKIDYTKHDWADIKFCDIGFQRLSFNTCRSNGWNFQLTSKYPFILIYQKLKYQIWTILGVPTSKCWFYELRPFDLITYSFWPCWWPPELYHWCGWGAGSHCPTPVWASHHGPGPPLQGTTRRVMIHTHYMNCLQISTTFELT